jgi:hypothetical protein
LSADFKDARSGVVYHNGRLGPLSIAELLRRGHDSFAELRVRTDDPGVGVRVVEDDDQHDVRHPVGPDPPEPMTARKPDLSIGERTRGSSARGTDAFRCERGANAPAPMQN